MRRARTRRRVRALLDAPGPFGTGTALAQAQAYCGPGHGRRWPVEAGHRPPAIVELQTPVGICSYRLLVHPRTQGPARDHQGRYPYLPTTG